MRAKVPIGSHAPASAIPRLPRDVGLACTIGLLVGAVAAGTGYASYLRAEGPTRAGAGIIAISALIVGVLRVLLARRRLPRASDWVVLGYTAAMVVSTIVFTVEELVRGLVGEFDQTIW